MAPGVRNEGGSSLYPLRTQLIESIAEFAELQDGWCRLASLTHAPPFQTFQWCHAWLRSIGAAQGCLPRVAAAWWGSHLVGILPLARRPYRGIRLLEWIGARVSDYCDALVDPAFDRALLLRTMWNEITGRPDYDIVRLGQVPRDGAIGSLLESSEIHPWVETREWTQNIPIRWKSSADWLGEQSAHNRKRIRAHARRLEQAGFTFYVWQPQDPWEPLADAMISQKKAWLARKGLGRLCDHMLGEQFLRAVIGSLATQGMLHLSALRAGNRFAACHLGFHQGGVLYGYMLAYDERYGCCSPGTTLQNALLMWACENGVRRIDILRGTHEYKLRFKPESQLLQTFVVAHTLLGRLCLLGYRLQVRVARVLRHARNWSSSRLPAAMAR